MKSHFSTCKIFGLLVVFVLIFTLAFGPLSSGVQAITIEDEFPLLEAGGYFSKCRWARILAYILELTDTQKQEIQSIIDSERSTFEPLIQKVVYLRRQLFEMNQSNTFDEVAVREIASQQSEAIAELIVIKNRISFRVFELLTAEQKNEVERLRNRVENRLRNCLAQNLMN
jgi:Spy/CpxP family protein refolding chaperone